MQSFKLRFRRRKALVVVGIMLALAITPLVQYSQAANAVNLDMDEAARLVTGPGSPTEFGSSVNVQHGNVVQVSTIVHNTEDAVSGPTAQNFKVHFSVPKGPVTSAQAKASVSADNAAPNANFKTSDAVTMNSANGKAFSLTQPRAFKLQRNDQVGNGNQAHFKFSDAGSDIPANRMQVTQTASSYEITVDPNGDGKLKPCFNEALRIVFLTDVTQTIAGPHMTIEKKVRNQGSQNWQDNNSAKPGETLEYAIRVSNEGASKATNLVISDSLPPLVSVEYLNGTCILKTSNNQTDRPCSDSIKDGGLQFNQIDPGGIIYVYLKVKVKQPANCPGYFFTNTARQKTNEAPESYDVVKTDVVCQTITTPTPTPTPSITPTPTPTPTPTLTPTPGPSTPPSTPPGPPAEKLPVTGAASIALLSTLALAISGYLYTRERRLLKKAVRTSRLK